MPKRYLYLIRNAQYAREEESQEGTLTLEGTEQRLRTAHAIAHLPVRAIHCSPYKQVRQTAHILAQAFGISPSETPLLRQYDTFTMNDGTLTRAQLLQAADSQHQQLEAATVVFIQPPPSHDDLHEVIVCHANIIRDMICRALGVNPASWAHMVIHNCGISCLAIDEAGNVELLSYNDVNHLPDHLQTL